MRTEKRDWFRILTHLGALLPLAVLMWDYWQGGFLVDPIREITSRTGKTALILLLLTLACTPLYILFKFRPALRVRRALGLYTFMYAGLHFLTFVGLDYRLDIPLIGDALLRQRFTLAGLLALLLLVPLAITSTKNWQKRLGQNWKRLHWLIYPAAVLVITHFLWLSKDPREPLLFGAGLLLLLMLRLRPIKRGLLRMRERLRLSFPGRHQSTGYTETDR